MYVYIDQYEGAKKSIRIWLSNKETPNKVEWTTLIQGNVSKFQVYECDPEGM